MGEFANFDETPGAASRACARPLCAKNRQLAGKSMPEKEISVGLRIWRFVRNTILLLVAAGVITGLVMFGIYQAEQRQIERVSFNVVAGLCKDSPLHPLGIGIVNKSSKTVHEVSFYIVARRPGYSSDLVSGGYHSWDRIIPPGEGEAACWAYPDLRGSAAVDKSALEWSVRRVHVRFKD